MCIFLISKTVNKAILKFAYYIKSLLIMNINIKKYKEVDNNEEKTIISIVVLLVVVLGIFGITKFAGAEGNNEGETNCCYS